MPSTLRVSAIVLTSCCLLVETARSAESSKPLADRISLIAPEDGGTPRDPKRIQAAGDGEFHIKASFEEGGERVLRHAVSRVDLMCRNSSTTPTEVTLHVDLSDDGRRTAFDDTPFGGMPTRGFLFVQPPGGKWRQVNGTTDRWIATIKFVAAPGDTKIGLSPWYTYTDYLRFINTLPNRPELTKTRIGQSDQGREHWELRITDHSVADVEKRTIFWHAREHAYETYSSFAMEGLVEFLMSDDAAAFRRRYVIVLHPMTNVDGVASGYEYRGGYDFPTPRGTETGRLTFAAIDRLRPDFAVAWHNWIAPRDRDVVFYTNTENGKSSRRAWDLFTQRFTSPRATGHQWNDETTPLKYNWHGRELREGNVHEYAMKHYGTKIWGWEMPWWNRSVEECRASGRAFGLAFLSTLDDLKEPAAASEDAAAIDVPRWEMHEFSFVGKSRLQHPDRDATLVGEFTSPSGKVSVVEGFHDGGNDWRLRFAPHELGNWRYRIRGEGVQISQTGLIRCTAAAGKGFIGIHPKNPYAFSYSDGTPFFPMGDTCYGLFDDSPITAELRAEYLKTRRAQQFNFVRMSVGHSPKRAAADPARYWAWGGTPEHPDLDHFNPAFFRAFDELLSQMRSEGMNAEILLLNLYREPFNDPKHWTPERESRWIRHLMARYSALSNVFLWTVANEYELHPDGQYRLDNPGDPDWAKATARIVKQHDPYHHPVTVHPVVSASALGSNPKGEFTPPWRVGEFFGKGSDLDVISQQTGQDGAGTQWDETLGCWTGDSAMLVDSIKADRRYSKPVMNTENGYEFLAGRGTMRKQVHHTDKVRRTSWRIVCAGGYFAAGFSGSIGHSDIWNELDAPNRYTFAIKGEGAADQLRHLYDFFTDLPYWQMQPFDGLKGTNAVALAEPGKVYVIYLPNGGETSIDLTSEKGSFSARWFDPRSGQRTNAPDIKGGDTATLHAPDQKDWTLLLRQK